MPQSLWLDCILLGLELYFLGISKGKHFKEQKMYFGQQNTTTKEQPFSVCYKIKALICHGLCYYSQAMWNRIQLLNLSASSLFKTPSKSRYFREKVLLFLFSFE